MAGHQISKVALKNVYGLTSMIGLGVEGVVIPTNNIAKAEIV